MDNMVRIEGSQLAALIGELTDPRQATLLRLNWNGDGTVCFKVNGYIWSPPVGSEQGPY